MPDSLQMTPAVLEILRLFQDPDDQQELWGSEISRLTGRPDGVIYPILERLHRHGWIADRWEELEERADHNPMRRRRLWRFTDAGRATARHVLRELEG